MASHTAPPPSAGSIPPSLLSRWALWAISCYQRYLSPRKGFRCAHRVLHGGKSCSGFAAEVIERDGLRSGWAQTRQRFKECGEAARELRALCRNVNCRHAQRGRLALAGGPVEGGGPLGGGNPFGESGMAGGYGGGPVEPKPSPDPLDPKKKKNEGGYCGDCSGCSNCSSCDCDDCGALGNIGQHGGHGGCDLPSCDVPHCNVPHCDVPHCDVPSCDCGDCSGCDGCSWN